MMSVSLGCGLMQTPEQSQVSWLLYCVPRPFSAAAFLETDLYFSLISLMILEL